MNGEYQEQEVPFINPNPIYQETDAEGTLQYQLDTDDLIQNLKFIILGFSKQKDGYGDSEWFDDPKKKPLITEEGWNALEPTLRGHIDKIFPLSDIDQQQIEFMTLGVEKDLRDLLSVNFIQGNSWRVPNLSTASAIKNIICDQVYATLSKARQRGYQNFLKTVQRVQEVQAFKGSLNPYNEPTQNQHTGLGRLPIVGKLFR